MARTLNRKIDTKASICFEADFGLEHADNFRRDLHPELRADFILAKPPFTNSDWFRKDVDVRWQFGFRPMATLTSPERSTSWPAHHY